MRHADISGAQAVHQSAYVQETDPGAVGAFKAWVDLSTNPAGYKVRNATNTGWILTGASVTQRELVDVHPVASEVEQLALVVQEGDVAIRSDLSRSFVHNGGTTGTMADWLELLTPPDSPHALLSASHTDVNSADVPAGGEVLTWDATAGKWVSAPLPAPGASALNDLSDATITTPSTGQVLKFDGTKWVNAADETGGGGGGTAASTQVTKLEKRTSESLVNGWNVVSWDTEVYDDGNWFVAAAPTRITPPVGEYGFVSQSSWVNNATGVRHIRLNHYDSAGTLKSMLEGPGVSASTDNFGRALVAGYIKVLAGDYLTIEVFQNSGAALSFGASGNAAIPHPQVTLISIGGGGTSDTSVFPAPVVVSASRVATSGEHLLLVDAAAGAITITLPTAVGISGKEYKVKKIDASANAVTVVPSGTETIDGKASISTTLVNDSVALESDGTNWKIVTPLQGGGGGSTTNRLTKVKRQAVQSIPFDAATPVTFDVAISNPDAMFDPATPTRITIKATGDYTVVANGLWANSSTGYRSLMVRKNGTTLEAQSITNGSVDVWGRDNVMGMMTLAANDYLEFVVQQGTTAALNFGGDAETFSVPPTLSIARIG